MGSGEHRRRQAHKKEKFYPSYFWGTTAMKRFFPADRETKARPPVRRRPEVERLEERNLLSFANVLVNDPTPDTTAIDTQSETAVVLGADSHVVVAYNDSSSFFQDPNLFTGYSLSKNGGKSFKDEGAVPLEPSGDGGDPVLARSSAT